MATVKLASLAIRTAAKPVAGWLKQQATEHERFRTFCINWAQRMHRMEARMRTGLVNGTGGDVKPLNETRAIQNGANNLAEIFLFGVAATLILGETYRGSRKTANRRDTVDDKLEELRDDVRTLQARWKEEEDELQRRASEAEERNTELQKILSAVVDAGLRNGWLSNQSTIGPDLKQEEVGREGHGVGRIARTLPVLDLTSWGIETEGEKDNGFASGSSTSSTPFSSGLSPSTSNSSEIVSHNEGLSSTTA